VKYKFIIMLAVFCQMIIFYLGCKPKDQGDTPSWGQDTLSSDGRLTGTVMEVQGFDFSEGRIRFEVPVVGGGILDMAVEPLISGNQAVGITLTSPSQLPAFYEMGNVYLESILEAPPNGYLTDVFLNSGYSYCVLTTESKYAKIYIVDSDYGEREDSSPYAWIRFDWVFQKDGGRSFD